jgi:hypothetical protein
MGITSGQHSIFISHTHADQGIADALRDAVRELFGDSITVHYSTNKEREGGIAPGQEWFRWIVEHVKEANVALVLLTPASIQKPWILWEAGAVAGSALASDTAKLNEATRPKVRPLVYQLTLRRRVRRG